MLSFDFNIYFFRIIKTFRISSICGGIKTPEFKTYIATMLIEVAATTHHK